MKTSKKLLSVLLALLLVFSTSSIAFAGVLTTERNSSVDSLVSKDGLADLVNSLLVTLNANKDNLVAPVLKIVFLSMNDEKLQATVSSVLGTKDIADAGAEELSKVLVEWLNKMLPEWLGDTSSIEKWSSLAKGAGLDISDLTSVNGLIKALRSACTSYTINTFGGELKRLNGDPLNSFYDGSASSAFAVVKSLFGFLAHEDNRYVITKVLQGGIKRSGGLDLGELVGLLNDMGFVDVDSALAEVNTVIDNIPDFLKSFVYLLIDGNAAKGDINGDAKGDWGKSAYASYTADQMLAAALIRLINKAEPSVVISKEACNKALGMSFYELLGEYAQDLYENYGVSTFLNENVKNLINDICVTPEITALYKPVEEINFNSEDFNNKLNVIFANAKTEGVLAQINAILYIAAEEILTPEAFGKLALSNTNGNADLNENLTKICRMALPLMADEEVKNRLGYDFSEFTEETVATMNIRQMAVAVLKLFFEDWFGNGKTNLYDDQLIKKAFCLEQLAAYAVYFTTGLEGVKSFLTDGATISALEEQRAKVYSINESNATEFILDTGAIIGYGALKANSEKLHFNVPTTLKGYKAIVDAVSDWGLNFIKGIPAVVNQEIKANRMTINKNNFDDAVNGGAFYKINVVLNELIDFSFFTNDKAEKATTSFKFDIGLFITDTLLENIYTFDIAGILNAFRKNNSENNILAGKNVVEQVLKFADRAVTALFKHECGATAKQEVKYSNCTEDVDFYCEYCSANGHYTKPAVNDIKTVSSHLRGGSPIGSVIDNGCKEKISYLFECELCHERYTEPGTYNGSHKYVYTKTVAPTCQDRGYDLYLCAICNGSDKNSKRNYTDKIDHIYENGKCTMCNAADPNAKPDVNYGDIDGNGILQAADARLCLRASVGLEVFASGSAQALACDVDGNGTIQAADARLILRKSVGLETSFPAEQK